MLYKPQKLLSIARTEVLIMYLELERKWEEMVSAYSKETIRPFSSME
jgi:hypothetical protein